MTGPTLEEVIAAVEDSMTSLDNPGFCKGDFTNTVYGYVPVKTVQAEFQEHGGIVQGEMPYQPVRIGEKMSDEFVMFVVVPILLCPVGWISLKVLEFYDNCLWLWMIIW